MSNSLVISNGTLIEEDNLAKPILKIKKMDKLFTIKDDRITLENNESVSFIKAFAQNGADFKDGCKIYLSIITTSNGAKQENFIKFNSFVNSNTPHTTVVNMAPKIVTNLGQHCKTEIIINGLQGEEQVLCEYLKSSNKIVPLPPNQNPFLVH